MWKRKLGSYTEVNMDLPLFDLFSFLVSFQTYLFQWLCFPDLCVMSSEGVYYLFLKCHKEGGNIF